MIHEFTNPILDEFTRSDSGPMVAAALRILARMADDSAERHNVLGPWAWDLRQRARQLEIAGRCSAATQAKVIARLVGLVALGQVSAAELSRAAADVQVEPHELRYALDVLELAMHLDLGIVA